MTTLARLLIGGVMIGILVALLLSPKPWLQEPPARIADFVRIFSWWAGLINLAPLAVLFLTVPWWTRPAPELAGLRTQNTTPRWFFSAVLAAMLVGATLDAVRLPHGLWSDEIYSLQHCVMGTTRVRDDGSVKFRRVSWTDTLWYYEKPTNHIFQSILSRLSLDVWRGMARPQGLQFCEPAVRFPSYVAGILSLGAMALLMAQAGLPWAGALTAWLLALHPWHMRFASEARAYGLVMLLAPLCCLFALRALETGRWRWWIALAAAEFALLYSWVPALTLVAVLNLCLLYRLLSNPQFRSSRSILLSRWLVGQVVAGMAFIQLFLPCVPQLFAYVEKAWDFPSHSFWLKNVGALFLTGSLWSKSGLLDSPYLEYLPHAQAHPVLFAVAITFGALFLVLGVVRFWRAGPSARLLGMVFLLPGPLMYALAALQHKYLFEWYVGFMLPGIVALVAAGALWLPDLRPGFSGRFLQGLVAVSLIVAFAMLSQPARRFLLTRSVQGDRQSVLATRPNLDPNSPANRNILTAGTSAVPKLYDPRIKRLKTLEQYSALMKEADERGLPLFINNGFLSVLRTNHPEIQALLEDPALFEHVRTFFGVEFILDCEVRKYRPGSIGGVDLSRYRKAMGTSPAPYAHPY